VIERIVLVKLSEAAVSDRQAIADQSRRVLERIPGVRSVRVARPADEPTAANCDLALVLRFDTLDEVEAYRIHPDHRAPDAMPARTDGVFVLRSRYAWGS
jgi:hypothetical protein